MRTTSLFKGLVAALLATGLGVSAATQAASAATEECTTRSVAKYFSKWSDNNNYFAVKEGTFESGISSWSVTGGAKVVSDQETWKVAGSSHSKALRIPAGATATTVTFCVASDEDSLRLFAKKPGVKGSALHIGIRVTSGVNVATNDYDLGGDQAGWAVSDRIMLPDIRDASGKQYVTITFSTRNTPADWVIDDVMIDPWRTN